MRVEDLGEKEAVLSAQPKSFFTIPHFDGYAAVLIQLQTVTKRALREALVDGWLACAPANLAQDYVDVERSASAGADRAKLDSPQASPSDRRAGTTASPTFSMNSTGSPVGISCTSTIPIAA